MWAAGRASSRHVGRSRSAAVARATRSTLARTAARRGDDAHRRIGIDTHRLSSTLAYHMSTGIVFPMGDGNGRRRDLAAMLQPCCGAHRRRAAGAGQARGEHVGLRGAQRPRRRPARTQAVWPRPSAPTRPASSRRLTSCSAARPDRPRAGPGGPPRPAAVDHRRTAAACGRPSSARSRRTRTACSPRSRPPTVTRSCARSALSTCPAGGHRGTAVSPPSDVSGQDVSGPGRPGSCRAAG